ncbi:MAG: DUF6036 family nucleotidyltransferase [Kofleriaceae bacterium]
MTLIEQFFIALDEQWPTFAAKQPIRIIGSSALMLQTSYTRGTSDSDVFETHDLSEAAKKRLLAIAGKDSALHKRRSMYIDVVANGIPFLPASPLWHPVDLNANLSKLEVFALDVVDVVVSKLRAARVQDFDDIREMVERGLVQHASLLDRFNLALPHLVDSADGENAYSCIESLHRVERDLLRVAETPIELPNWLTEL